MGGYSEANESKQSAFQVSGLAESVAYDYNDHYTLAGELYRLMDEGERKRLVETIIEAMKPVEREILSFVKSSISINQTLSMVSKLLKG